MKIEFDRIDISNFKSFNGAASLDIRKLGSGLIMVRGRNEDEPRLESNGAGKSSLFGALCWCLYGKTENGLRNPDIRPWGGSPGTTRVAVRFSTDGDANEVVRTAEPNKLTLGGRVVWQESIDKLLLPYDLFIHTILLGQGQPLFLDLPPREKMELFTAVLNLEVWDRRSWEASGRAEALSRQQAAEQAQLDANGAMLVSVEARIEQAQLRVAEFETERQARLANLFATIEKTNKDIAALQPQVEAAMLAAECDAELRLLRKDIYVAQQQQGKRRAEAAAAAERARHAERELLRLIGERNKAKTAKTCPTCGQPVKRANLTEHMRHLEAQIAVHEDSRNNPAVPPDAPDVAGMQATAEAMQRKVDAAQSVITAHGPLLIKLRAQLPHLEETVAALTEQDNPHHAVLSDAKRQATQLQVKLREGKQRAAALEAQAARAKFWVKGFKEVRLTRTDEVLADLELATNAALVEVGLEGWSVKYVVEEETKAGTLKRGMAVSVTSPSNRDPVRWESWSGGEAQRLRVVCALALSDTLLAHAGIESSFEVLDEPTAHMSGSGIRDLCEYLGDRARSYGKGIYFVDHRALVESSFDGIVEIVKQGGSRIL